MNKCPRHTNEIQLSLDGVQESKSSNVSIDVYSISFKGCKSVFPIRLIRPVNKYKVDELAQLEKVLKDINDNSLVITDIIADNLKRAFLRRAKIHSATFGCEYCESAAIQKKDPKAINLIKSNYDLQRKNVQDQIDFLQDAPGNSRGKEQDEKKIKALKKIITNLNRQEKSELSNFGSNRLCWPSSTMNGKLRSQESVQEIAEQIANTEAPLPPNESKGIVGKSLLLSQNNFNIVDNLPVEYMHLVCLGAVKRLTNLTFKVGETRTRLTKRKLSDPKDFDKLIRLLKVPFEFSRRCRNLDFSVLKASEFRNLILFFFPIVVQCIGNAHKIEQNIWLDLAFMIRACNVTNSEFNKINKDVVKKCAKNFYMNYEKMYGSQNCTYSIHNVGSHILKIRGDVPLSERSAFLFESFYSEMKNLFCAGTSSPLKQILQNCYMKRQLEKHRCSKKIKYQKPPKKEVRENNSSIYVLTNNGHEMYNIFDENPDGSFNCHKQGKFEATFNDTIKKNWKHVGVYKLGPTGNIPVKINRNEIAGKVIKVNEYLITCPNHVLQEQ